MKSGTSPGWSADGGLLGEAQGYTPGIGAPEDGDGNGANVYELMGIGVGSGWVGTEDGREGDERSGGEVGEEEAAKVCPVPSRTRKMECRMDPQYRCSTSQEELGGSVGITCPLLPIITRVRRRRSELSCGESAPRGLWLAHQGAS